MVRLDYDPREGVLIRVLVGVRDVGLNQVSLGSRVVLWLVLVI